MPVQMAALAFVVRDAMTGIEFEAASNKHGETLLVGVWQGGGVPQSRRSSSRCFGFSRGERAGSAAFWMLSERFELYHSNFAVAGRPFRRAWQATMGKGERK